MHIFAGMFVFIFMLLPVTSFASQYLPVHDLRIRFDPGRNILFGVSEIKVPGQRALAVSLKGLSVKSATLDGRPVAVDSGKPEVLINSLPADRKLRIEFTFSGSPGADDRSGNPGVVAGNLINKRGISLTDGWYPSINGLATYILTATVPPGFEAVSEADEITVDDMPGGERRFSFHFPHPAMNINFIAGRYTVGKATRNGMDIYTYFLPEDAGLAGTYMEHAKKYFDLYEGMLGKYPFKRFSIVENILPTGYSMPAFTLLGQDVVRLPFIVETSLGHEILHQWFGCGVYVDFSRGNWSEGLATYLADHLYEERKGQGGAYRKQMLTAFQSAVGEGDDFPLKAFLSRTDRASSAIGYYKAAMVFHMLKGLLGEDLFNKALRRFAAENLFTQATWASIRAVFESVSGQDLEWFFRQWIDGKGVPDLRLQNAVVSYRGSGAVVSFDIVQKGEVFRLLLPVKVITREGAVLKTLTVTKASEHLEIEVEGSPAELAVDGGTDLFRRLADAEYPPVISRLINDSARTAVIPAGKEKDYEKAREILKKEGFTVVNEQDVTHDMLRKAPLLVIGSQSPVAKRLFARLPKVEADFSVVTKVNPFDPKKVVVLLDSSSPADIGQYFPRLMHYGRYSNVAFRGGRNTVKEVARTEEGLRARLAASVSGIETRRMLDLPTIIDSVSGKKVVYVGEIHDSFEHHRIQFEIIRGLHKKNGKVAIGMEMFQRPFQGFLDEYIAGSIGEKEFLRKTEYFRRWGFDYNLYREIMLYAREHRIPVIALNTDREIVAKVSREGIYGLTKDELGEIPPEMDLSDNAYRSRLMDSFHSHKGSAERNFDFFFQAQVLWDETMAYAVDAYLRENPEYQVIVLAGGGHMAYGSGIPVRAHRLNGLDYGIILNGNEPHDGLADYVLISEPLPYLRSPLLMVQFADAGGMLRITGFPDGSISEKAGLKEGDIVLSIDGEEMRVIDDVRIFLLGRKKGDTVKVKVRRSRFLLGDREMTFDVSL